MTCYPQGNEEIISVVVCEEVGPLEVGVSMDGRDISKTGCSGYPWRREKQFSTIKGQKGTFTVCGCFNCFAEEFISCITNVKKKTQNN